MNKLIHLNINSIKIHCDHHSLAQKMLEGETNNAEDCETHFVVLENKYPR